MNSDPKLKQAFIKAIKHYFASTDVTPSEYNKSVGERKYDKKYLDSLDTELNNSDSEKDKEVKKIKGKAKKNEKL